MPRRPQAPYGDDCRRRRTHHFLVGGLLCVWGTGGSDVNHHHLQAVRSERTLLYPRTAAHAATLVVVAIPLHPDTRGSPDAQRTNLRIANLNTLWR